MTSKVLPFLQSGGTVLSDHDIKLAIKSGYVEWKSPYPLKTQPASIDLHIAKTILTFARRRVENGAIDLKKSVDSFIEYENIDPTKGAVIHPHEFILGVTEEWVHLPNQLLANVDGKSSLGRLGLVIHATAGFIDPGFTGHVTLEITNLTEQPLIIYPHMPIGQIRFTVMTSPADIPYGDVRLKSKGYVNKYSKNPKPIASQYYKNFSK
ncbi:MAG: dCTP deaminase [Candidatus Daviesbacteria bacterium]|nr:dCTP deaminase [Candidatus Daviesbacteria bacterium]